LPEPSAEDLWTDIYYKGTEPPVMRGREREEVCIAFFLETPKLIEEHRSIVIRC
jgi:pyruvate dehydrogenase E1 component alpha subunit